MFLGLLMSDEIVRSAQRLDEISEGKEVEERGAPFKARHKTRA